MKKLIALLIVAIVVLLGFTTAANARITSGSQSGGEGVNDRPPTTQSDYIRLYSYKCPRGQLCLFDRTYFNGERVKLEVPTLKDSGVQSNSHALCGDSPANFEDSNFNNKATSVINRTGMSVTLFENEACDAGGRLIIHNNQYVANLGYKNSNGSYRYKFSNRNSSNNAISAASIELGPGDQPN